ncbi:MAG: S-layer homology domain-containing protein [Clostridia bacterium]|nr:S-layer homology domain-containing protein [Clostridia bacterium]
MKKLTSVLMTVLMIFSSFCGFAQFDDIDSDTLSWAGDAIDNLVELKVINGYEDGSFRPNANVTRAEFAKMITVAFDLEKADVYYDDISAHWAREFILSASDVMYAPDASFKPDKDATRADIAFCAASVLKLSATNEDSIKKYSDYESIPADMLSMICASSENGLVVGYKDGTIRPNSSVTRAEAAVIVHRALTLKDKDDNTPEIPPVTEDENPQEKDHLSNLYPGKDLILVISVNQTVDAKNGESAYKIVYKLADGEEEYASVVPEDTKVTGVKNDISNLSAGDVLIMNTAFHGYIGNLHVFAAFGSSNFNFDHTVTGYGKGDYAIFGGKIKELKRAGKNIMAVLEAGGEEKTVFIPAGLEANVFSPWNKKDKWSYGYINDVDPFTEEEYAFVRFTNGLATDVVVSDFIR